MTAVRHVDDLPMADLEPAVWPVTAVRAADGDLFSIMRPDIERALREAVEPAAELRYATTIDSIANHADGVEVTLSDLRTDPWDFAVVQ